MRGWRLGHIASYLAAVGGLTHGLPGDEAVAVVRKVGPPLGPVSGAARGEADGFTCVRTGQTDGPGLPAAIYECTRGTQRITFTRR